MDKARIRKARVKYLTTLLKLNNKHHALWRDEKAAFAEFCTALDDSEDPPTFFNAIRTWFGEKTVFPDVDPVTQHLQD